jgi:metallo-beta-lactamase family protein
MSAVGLKLSFLGGAETVTGSKYAVEHEAIRFSSIAAYFRDSKRFASRTGRRFPSSRATSRRSSSPTPIWTTAATCRCWSSAASAAASFAHMRQPIYARSSCPTPDIYKRRTPNTRTATAFPNTSLPCPSTPKRMHRRRLCTWHRFPSNRIGHCLAGARSGFGARVISSEPPPYKLDWAGTTIVFSGDLGRYDDSTMVDPVSIDRTDHLVVA